MKQIYFAASILLCMNFISDSKAQDKATDLGLEKLYKYADSTTTDVLQMDAQNLAKLNLDGVAKLTEKLKKSSKLNKQWKLCSSVTDGVFQDLNRELTRIPTTDNPLRFRPDLVDARTLERVTICARAHHPQAMLALGFIIDPFHNFQINLNQPTTGLQNTDVFDSRFYKGGNRLASALDFYATAMMNDNTANSIQLYNIAIRGISQTIVDSTDTLLGALLDEFDCSLDLNAALISADKIKNEACLQRGVTPTIRQYAAVTDAHIRRLQELKKNTSNALRRTENISKTRYIQNYEKIIEMAKLLGFDNILTLTVEIKATGEKALAGSPESIEETRNLLKDNLSKIDSLIAEAHKRKAKAL